MSEYIKRELAEWGIALKTNMSLEQAREIIKNVPSVEPPKKVVAEVKVDTDERKVPSEVCDG